MSACLEDVVPAAPIRTLCDRIEADHDHHCSWDPMPDSGHIACAPAGIDRCRLWFEDLLADL